jgi:hypothetical protein
MQTLNLTQGDDWQIDLYLEEQVGGVWQPVDISGVTFAMALKARTFTQAVTLTKISNPGGHARASLTSAQTQAAPIGRLMSNVQMTYDGKVSSAGPLAIECIEDFT